MKNVILLPTNKPSSLYLGNNGNFVFGMIQTSIQSRNDDFTNQHLYITSDEEIKEGDCFLEKAGRQFPIKWDGKEKLNFHCKKIILTTDGDLIKEGVQAIDEDFLEWFVKNPSCERVDVDTRPKVSSPYEKGFVIDNPNYNKIIISKEERKRHLIEIMKGDEELGLYDMVQHKPTQETKLTFIEWIGLFRWMGKTS